MVDTVSVMRGQRKSITGFSLIELLVVVSVIAILASLLAPTLSRAKQRGHSAVCKNNLRQISIGVALYADDFGVYPVGGAIPRYYGIRDEPATVWHMFLEPYVKARWPRTNFQLSQYNHATRVRRVQPNIFVCPGYNSLSGLFLDPNNLLQEHGLGAYAYNGWGVRYPHFYAGVDYDEPVGILGLGPWQSPYGKPVTTDAIVSPADMIAIVDAPLEQGEMTNFDDHPLGAVNPWDALFRPLSPSGINAKRHGGVCNVVFADGHIEGKEPLAFFGIRENPNRAARWNNDNKPHSEFWR